MDSTQLWTLTDGNAGNRRQADALAAALTHGPVMDWVLEPQAPWSWCAPRALPRASAAFGTSFAHALAQSPRLAIGCGRQGALATRLLRQRGSKVVQILDVGVDVPSVGCIILAGGGKAEVANRQRIGRGLRAKKLGPNIDSTCHWMPSAASPTECPQPTMASGAAVITKLISP